MWRRGQEFYLLLEIACIFEIVHFMQNLSYGLNNLKIWQPITLIQLASMNIWIDIDYQKQGCGTLEIETFPV